jgi:ABC-type transport system substrate-binding protein
MVLGLVACTNDPYPEADEAERVFYTSFPGPPRTLDPAVAYSTLDHMVTGPVYGTLLEYHYLERPFRLIPSLVESVPEPEPQPDGRVAYRFRLQEGLRFQDDPCFELSAPGQTTRAVGAADVAFELMRLADPLVNSPVVGTFVRIVGFEEFATRLTERRKDPEFAAQRIDVQYAQAGGIEGVRVEGERDLVIVLREAYPQILYWFGMEFTSPVPWEAVVYYDGEGGRDAFAEHPVGNGPFRIALYDKRSRIVLEQSPTWRGVLFPDRPAPGAVYPDTGETGDAEAGLLDPKYVGKPLPLLDRVELRLEKETIPAFAKFLQGYYDVSSVLEESFDKVVHEGALSPEMESLGMTLEKAVTPSVYYLGFNMEDAVVGTPAGERGRLLRQALSLAIDTEEYTRIFLNGRGVPAQSPIPPGLFGYEPEYRNPFRLPDPERARALLREAGYPDGIDAETGKPLRLTFDTGDTSARGRLRYQFFVDAWRRIGIDAEIAATNYNEFQEKVRRGTYQVFMWGWVADYPDPENFLFLLHGPMARSAGGPNTANFIHPEYDALFEQMRDQPKNDAHRLELIRRMRAILERERPWIELIHVESYALIQGWVANAKPLGMSYSTLKYLDVDPTLREEKQVAWNQPVTWPAWVLAGVAVAAVLPAAVTIRRRAR